ncbi:Phosphorylase superfamily protein [Metarhizium rileyi]|uniref:Phosphorylase superfamily protein n=1 Tax=Metarhizium rileyi (strain RCEF 4871) TaxID=1649241 RepID=A0A167GU74_METRR|nr:Phosphorylase superfamily protein [Metarhizium rileyi RCEF 4871]
MTTDKESYSNLRRLRNRPACIICGRPAEAQRIALALGIGDERHRLSGHDVSMVRDGHTFHLGQFELSSGIILKYYITGSLRQGIQSFAVSAAMLFNTQTVGRNAIALDMEASAFIQLCKYFEPNGPICLGVVKGISDFGDSKKGEDASAETSALDNTAIAIKEWLTHRIPSAKWEVDESDKPGAKLVSGYYENFVRRVIDNHLEGLPIAFRHRPEVVIPGSEVRCFISVLPKDQHPQFVKEIGQIQRTILDGIKEFNIGTNAAQRYVHYKGGLVGEEDAEHQVGIFARTLKKQAYYRQAGASGPLARVLLWEEAMSLLGELRQKEQMNPRSDLGPDGKTLDGGSLQRNTKRHAATTAKQERKSRISQLFAFAGVRRQGKDNVKEPMSAQSSWSVLDCK